MALHAAHLIERIGRLVQAEEQSGGLPPVQWDVLRYLARANRFSRSPAVVAAYLGSTRGTVSQTLIALEAKGYVERRPSERDRRSVDLALTERGRAVLAADPLLTLADDIAATAGKGATELARALERVLTAVVERNGRKAFGLCRSCRHFGEGSGASPELRHRCGLLGLDLSDADAGQICAESARPDAA
ncbi:MarR family transcriptional regulator [Microvirga thermotolerans]|uniref:MarR family transcriptional regulator n=2 Tax=Microvirga thermotolerans TaxID=2651334 RepID=A0A5P9K0W2_9HYPH|nr:MarR family transcriptional regulator [Microvirga thermotolerans]